MVPCTWKWKPLCSLPARLVGSCHLFPSSLKLICPRARSALVLGGPCTNLLVPLASTTPGKAFSSSCLHWMPLIPGLLCRGDQDGPGCRQWCRVPLEQGNAEWFTQPAEQAEVLSTSQIAMEVVREGPVGNTVKVPFRWWLASTPGAEEPCDEGRDAQGSAATILTYFIVFM